MATITPEYLMDLVRRQKVQGWSDKLYLPLEEKAEYILQKALPRQRGLFMRSQIDACLGHNLDDRLLLAGLLIMLETKGFKTYVCWLDDLSLKDKPFNARLYKKNKLVIDSSRMLFYAFREDLPVQAWGNRQLAYADGRLGKSAVIPITHKEEGFFPIPEKIGCCYQVQRMNFPTTGEELVVCETPQKWGRLVNGMGLRYRAWFLIENPLEHLVQRKIIQKPVSLFETLPEAVGQRIEALKRREEYWIEGIY